MQPCNGGTVSCDVTRERGGGREERFPVRYASKEFQC